MTYIHETEKCEFVRINTDIPVRYKFLSHSVAIDAEGVYEGSTCNLSSQGLLLVGKVPGMSWIPGLLMGEIIFGLNILLPYLDAPVKTLARVAWVESFEKGSDKCSMGLRFQDTPKEQQDEILKYIIKAQIKR
tara:strand:- start:158 stop:556 length:399 start_codon:yes stop_codon:yes gene_type:complete